MIKTTTKTMYICDKCKKELLTPFIIKGRVEKQRFHYFEFHLCNSCLGEVVSGLSVNLTISGNDAEK